MDIQVLYLRSYEFAEEEHSDPMTDEEYQFVIDILNRLNSKEFLNNEEKHEVEVAFAILLHFDKETAIASMKLSENLKEVLNKIYSE